MKHVPLFLSLALLSLSHGTVYGDDQRQPELVRLQELDPPENGSHACLSGDGVSIVWEVGGKVWMANRKNADSLFENKAEVSYGRHPYLSDDGLELFTIARRADGGQGDSLFVATRPSIEAAFSRPREIVELNRQSSPKSPSLSADGLSLYFTRTGTDGKSPEFAVATRPSRDGVWSTPKILRMNRNGVTGALTWMSMTDGGTLLLCSLEPAPGPDGNLFVWTKQTMEPTPNPNSSESTVLLHWRDVPLDTSPQPKNSISRRSLIEANSSCGSCETLI